MNVRTVALVESATQLINATEWAHDSGEVADTRIVVLAPSDHESVRQINAVAAASRRSGLSVSVRPVRAVGPGLPLRAARVVSEIAGAGRLVIGDPFSRYIQTILPAARARQIVIVDDGTATWDFASCVDQGSPLVRWTRQPKQPRAHAVRATALLTPSAHRAVDVYSCLRDAVPRGATPLANRYRWVRSQHRPAVVADQIDLLGTSLVGSGVVDHHAYLNAIAAIARTGARVRYLAHRRESAALVDEIATLGNIRVVRPDRPVELFLRAGPVGRQVIAFPSTAAHTLPIVLADLVADLVAEHRVDIRVQAIDPIWFTPNATTRARSFVARIAADAPVAPHLSSPALLAHRD